ncbi:hypothetical protein [Synechocystis salina]|uniref:Uncharacterized protein n=1 Tax=Synechocystis salina LEGE 00031 TaxID=1828736 RepID=A0ABR9VUK3_9SYNC|nr:hypothetical protein [Synechocystis salina]MBE9241080.1 hypothetical protein [Synechocystis salina LEGE 00041]MBE9254568.1 hypothetical protein [Synechocystis salina LEGE 00031]
MNLGQALTGERMMDMDVEAKLDRARNLLNELGNAVSGLVGVAPNALKVAKKSYLVTI